MKKILHITERSFPPEIRVVKECKSLSEVGFDMAVMCPYIDGRPIIETWEKTKVYRPYIVFRNSIIRLLNKIPWFLFFIDIGWFLALKKAIRRFNPDAIHVHDIWLGRAARLASRNRILIMDLHENMPAAVMEYRKAVPSGAKNRLESLIHSHARILRYERSILKKCNRVLVVVKEARERVLSQHPVSDEKVINVENLESRSFLQRNKIMETPDMDPSLFNILYMGGFGTHRGIDVLVEAMRFVKEWELDVRLHLVGARAGNPYLSVIQDRTTDLEINDVVNIAGWVPFDHVFSYIKMASLCAVPHHSNPHTDNTIPHKLYQYMIASKPVIVSTSRPLARVVKQAKAGEVFEAGNPLDLAHKIRMMYKLGERILEYGSNGYKYVIEDGHNWENESAPILIDTYRNLFQT